MWELPLDRKNGPPRGRGEIGHSQPYTCAHWMTGYPEEAEARSGIFVPCETPKKKLLPPSALPIPPLVLPTPGPRPCQHLHNHTKEKHRPLSLKAKVQACHPAVYVSMPRNGHNSTQGEDVVECLGHDLEEGGGKPYHKEMFLCRC